MANHAAAPSHSAAACGISISIAAGILLGLVSCSDDNASSTAATAAVVLPRQEGDSDSGAGGRFTLELPPSPYLLGGVYGERRSPRRAALSGRVTLGGCPWRSREITGGELPADPPRTALGARVQPVPGDVGRQLDQLVGAVP